MDKLKRRFLAGMVSLIAFLFHDKLSLAQEKVGLDNQAAVAAQTHTVKLSQAKNFKEWSRVRSNWLSIGTLSLANYEDMEKLIDVKKKENLALLFVFVNAGIFTKEGAEVFNDIYGDRIYHRLRPMAATCYKPTPLGMMQGNTRGDIEKRLKELDKISKAGSVNEDTLSQARINLLKDMEMALRINELWEKQDREGWDKYREEEREILSYFSGEGYVASGISDDINIRNGVTEAMEIIKSIYTN